MARDFHNLCPKSIVPIAHEFQTRFLQFWDIFRIDLISLKKPSESTPIEGTLVPMPMSFVDVRLASIQGTGNAVFCYKLGPSFSCGRTVKTRTEEGTGIPSRMVPPMYSFETSGMKMTTS